jgi:DNA repair protein RecN (Recombination protein N)
MLTELHIENFAIIENLGLHFGPGLITFTGETGAGKSIIIDAVETLLGGRADAALVRSGSDRAYVEGLFYLPEAARPGLHAILEREELLDDLDYLSLGREIRLSGRNVARINGRVVNASLLHELGEFLIDLHGQSEHLSLLRVHQHLALLDRYALAIAQRAPEPMRSPAKRSTSDFEAQSSIQELLKSYDQTYQEIRAVQHELQELRLSEQDAARRSDMLSFQINEIESARLRPGEEEDLRDERNRLANAEGLANLAQQALLALDEGTPEAPATTDLLGQVVAALNSLARLDPSQAAFHEQALAMFESLSDLSGSLHNYLEGIEFNPKRLDQVEERLDLINNLKRKYGATILDILSFGEDARRKLDAITHASERVQELESTRRELLAQLGQVGQALSQARREAAEKLTRSIEMELVDLHMSGAQFLVDFQQRPDPEGAPMQDGRRVAYDANGLERVEFLIAPNPGEGFKPLAKIASGGETSRLMLALKNVLAQADQVPTLIFDEIDQGIGGRVGSVVGQKLWSLARQHQVLCITHLPQLAVYGEQHFQVQKIIEGERTITQVKLLEGEARLLELAQMLGNVSAGTMHSARELVQSVSKWTEAAKA